MGLNMVVLVKQVPDTQNITEQAMKQDGTVNRDALPAIFNPEDLHALEEALQLKNDHGGQVTVLSMGPPKAVEVLKESLYRGADEAILISDRIFAGADTLATSYALQCAVQNTGDFDLVFCGRQAIDGDTAQVGPQVAEKLGINQLTSVCAISGLQKGEITVWRSTEQGYEQLKSRLPVLLTVTAEANEPRPPSAKRVMAYKNVLCAEQDSYDQSYLDQSCASASMVIRQWNADSIGADPERCGLKGSWTQVKKIENVILSAREAKEIEPTEEGVFDLIRELKQEHIIG
ncbi:MAG: electron transfer flavoprotein subunit beta/FixA family protein [Thermodesulfobacteriota bacterium]